MIREYRTREQKRAFYRSGEWLSLKAVALERDNYECQECKRLGYLTIKESKPDKQKVLDVDHIKEIEKFPELALELDNLKTLCIKHHNAKHGRFGVKKANKWAKDEKW